MKEITYRIDLLEPALVTSLQGDPNSSVAFDYLPGSVLRGMLIGKYLNSQPVGSDDSTLRRLFFDGTVCYLNGYPLDVHGQPGQPVPASWQRVKYDESGEIFDFAIKAQNTEQQWQAVKAPFYTLSGEEVRLIQPARNVAIHTQRTARFGRAMPKYRPVESGQTSGGAIPQLGKDEIPGTVYRYDALAAGQTFAATIICDNDEDEPTLRALLDGYVTIGGSRSGGYGRAKIRLLANSDSRQDETEDDRDLPEGVLIVTLQSNALLRDGRGQFTVDPKHISQVLSNHLGVPLKLKGAFLAAEALGGFNRKWGLPLPQTLAVSMGSVLIFQNPGCDRALLDKLEARGIGERRAEGFGRIAFNRQRFPKLMLKENVRENSTLAVSINDKEAHKLAQLMVNRMFRQRLDEALLAAANDKTIANPPSNAQISRLRAIVLGEYRKKAPDPAVICAFIKSIEARSSARRQFERSIINKEPLLRWLKRLLRNDSPGIWTMNDNDWRSSLSLTSKEASPSVGGLSAETDNALRLEYVLRLIDLVLARAAKQRGEED